MSSISPGTPASLTLFNGIPPTVLVSLATGPVLLALVGGRTLERLLLELGQSSEELFRGDRLPILSFPEPSTPK